MNIEDKKISYMEADESIMDEVGKLWSMLNEHHKAKSEYFTEFFSKYTFDKRKAVLFKKIEKGCMRIKVAKDDEANIFIGYCISTVSGDEGEIESLFVLPKYRGYGIGDYFMTDAIGWLNDKGVKTKRIGVSYGNDEVLGFYHKYGFYERTIILSERK